MAARFGLVAMNLIAPGLSLFRLQSPKEGTAFLFGWPAVLSLLTVIAHVAPTVSPLGYAVLVVAAVLGYLFILTASSVHTWRSSRLASNLTRWWQRWYGLVVIYVLALLAGFTAVAFARTVYRPYFAPAGSMEPTIAVGDRFVADMRARKYRRGDVVMVGVGNVDFVKRIAAVGGDRIKLVTGVVFVNDVAAEQHLPRPYRTGNRDAQRLTERLPGEIGSHEILDMGPDLYDEMPEQLVPSNHVFLLGDNRDNSADSRIDKVSQGFGGAVPVDDVRGLALFKSYDSEWRWLGQVIR